MKLQDLFEFRDDDDHDDNSDFRATHEVIKEFNAENQDEPQDADFQPGDQLMFDRKEKDVVFFYDSADDRINYLWACTAEDWKNSVRSI